MKLVSTNRWPEGPPPTVGRGRTEALRDFDGILFSEPFRRLHDKTQVFPMPEDDHVSTRLTHSLEVASIGRSLGRIVGLLLNERGGDAAHISRTDLGEFVSAACLTHDIGNPPFGHAGEQAIRSWFKAKRDTDWFGALDAAQQSDFLHFNGNAQGFRLLTRLARGDRAGGLQLTASTLAAMLKYPWVSGTPGRDEHKFSAFQSELDQLRWVAQQTDLPQVAGINCWARHPLAYLVEAADDMAYLTRDLEDGLRLRLIAYDEYVDTLEPIASLSPEYRRPQAPSRNDAKQRDAAAYLRTAAIGALLEVAAEAFVDRWPCCCTGKPLALLASTKASEAVANAKKFAQKRCYDAKQVLFLELSGHNVLHRLLDLMELAAFRISKTETSARGEKLAKLLEWDEQDIARMTAYERMQRVLDVVSGMTDRYAVNFCKKVYGITLPRQH